MKSTLGTVMTWEMRPVQPVKLLVGILACDEQALTACHAPLVKAFGPADLVSQVWPFDLTEYYKDEAGPAMVRQFMAFERLIDPGQIAEIKHQTNRMERELAAALQTPYPRPINLDPGYIEPSKLVLASTKNFAHRIYLGRQMYAEVTMTYTKGKWETFAFTFPDFKSGRYNDFLSSVRERVVQQLRDRKRNVNSFGQD
ncbi:MAG: DUF4416 family protein [Planctomycetaceae bacterium]|nr:DUF4416 family protein [Planctomycetaceae bacterium]